VNVTSSFSGCALQQPFFSINTLVMPELDLLLPAQDYKVLLEANDPVEVFNEDVLGFFRDQNNVFPIPDQLGLSRTVTFQSGTIGLAHFTFRATPTINLKATSANNRPDCFFGQDSNKAVLVVDSGISLELDFALFEVYLPRQGSQFNTQCHDVDGDVIIAESVTGDGSAR
jgi:hypothetical protein